MKARIPRTEKDDTAVEEFVKSNNSRGTELQLKHDLLLTEFVWTHNNPRRTRYEQNTFRYSPVSYTHLDVYKRQILQ